MTDTRTILSITDPYWADANRAMVSAVVEFADRPDLGSHPFTATDNADTPYGQEIWDRVTAGEFGPIAPYEAPPPPPLTPLTRRQLRLGLLANEITTAAIEAAIAAIPDPMDRAVAEIEWADASTYERDHPLIEQVGSALGLTPEQIDTMWQGALAL